MDPFFTEEQLNNMSRENMMEVSKRQILRLPLNLTPLL